MSIVYSFLSIFLLDRLIPSSHNSPGAITAQDHSQGHSQGKELVCPRQVPVSVYRENKIAYICADFHDQKIAIVV